MKPVKAIFLDIDGVLNNMATNKEIRSKSHCGIHIGIDKDKVQRLAKIVQATDAILILSSSWKVGWEPKKKYFCQPGTIGYNHHAKYLDNHLKKKGNLVLTDKTKERNLDYRGMGIKLYLMAHPEITNWIVLDDEIFIDFQKENILSHLVKTDPNYGLTDNDVKIAIDMLNNGTIINNIKVTNNIIKKEAGPALKGE